MARARPWHLPVIGWLAVIWGALNVLDYLLTQFAVPVYLNLFTEPLVEYFLTLPPWLDLLWAVAVWTGLAGAVCIVGGARAAALLLGIAATAFLVFTLGLIFLTSPQMETVTGPLGVWVMVASTAIYALFWLYARAEHAAGDLP